MPTFLHTTAKCARVIIETEEVHPLRAAGRVDIGTTLVLLCPHVAQLFQERFPPVLAEATKVRSYTIRASNSPPRPPLAPTTHRALMPLRPHR